MLNKGKQLIVLAVLLIVVIFGLLSQQVTAQSEGQSSAQANEIERTRAEMIAAERGIDRIVQSDQPPSDDRFLLQKQLHDGGTAIVMVELTEPVVYELLLRNNAEIAAQRATIAAAQSRVADLLPSTNNQVKRTFETLPYMSLVVDAQGLGALMQSPDVSLIQLVRSSSIDLASTLPIIGADSAWSRGFDGSGRAIAILDTGVDLTHPWFTTGGNRIVSEACYSTNNPADNRSSLCPGGVTASTAVGSGDDCTEETAALAGNAREQCEHGTHVAGIAAGNDGTNFGVARGANVVAMQVFHVVQNPTMDVDICKGSASCVSANDDDLAAGLNRAFAIRSQFNLRAVNMSLSASNLTFATVCDNGQGVPQVVVAAINQLTLADVAVVATTGNDARRTTVNYPACIANAIAIGNTDDNDDVAGDSNIGAIVDLIAPGVDVTSAVPGGGTEGKSGTSMSAPHVAGSFAILDQAYNAFNYPDTFFPIVEYLRRLQWTGRIVDDQRSGGSVTGMRRINIGNAAGPSVFVNTVVSDSGNGNATSPYGSVQNAANYGPAGGTIWIRPGTYYETIIIARPVTLRSTGGTVRIEP